jgi:hypothetical protein
MPAQGHRGAWEGPLRRSRRVDWLLLATLLPVYLVPVETSSAGAR